MTRRYTDTTLTLLVKNRDLRSARKVYVTISQYIPDDVDLSNISSTFYSGESYKKEIITIQASASNISYSNPNTIIVVSLTQAQNAKFKEGYVRIQINWMDVSNKRKATVVKRVRHYENLHEEVLT